MTGQPYLRQVRFLAACAAVTAAIAICSIYLIRVECDRLTAGAATERALRGAMHQRLVRLDLAWSRMAIASNTEEFAAAEAGSKALGGHSEELRQTLRDRMLARERQGEASRALLREIESVGALSRSTPAELARIRQLAAASSPPVQEQQSEIARVLTNVRQALERAPQPELAGIRNAERKQKRALQQVAIFSLTIFLAGLSGAALLISAGRILTRHFQREIGALQSLYKHTVRKTNRTFYKMGGVASAIGRVAVKLAPVRGTGELQATKLIDSATDAVRALQVSVVEIGNVTEQIRDIAFKTNILDLKTAIEAADAGDQSAGLGIVAVEVKSLATGISACVAGIGAQTSALESQLSGIGAILLQLRQMDADPNAAGAAVTVRAIPRSLAPEQEQLYKLAAAMEALCGKDALCGKPAQDRPKPVSNSRRPGSIQSIDCAESPAAAHSVLL